MGTKVQNPPGYYSMRDLNEESSSCGWPLFYGDKTPTNGKHYNSYLPSPTADACSVYDKDAVKRMMLEHEAIFKNQVYELHRLYRIQRDLMSEYKRKEFHRNPIPAEASFSAGPLTSQITNEDAKKWHTSGFPIGSSTCAKTSVSGAEGIHSPLGSIKGMSQQDGPFPSPNGCSLKDVDALESRPSKVRRRMFDLHLPADEYIDDTEENEKLSNEKIGGPTLFLSDRNCKNGKEDDGKHFYGNGVKTGSQEDASRSEQSLSIRNGLADLNEPVQVEETYDSPYVHLLSHTSRQAATECSDLTATSKQKSQFFGLSRENLPNSHHGTDSWARNNGYLKNNETGKGWIPSSVEAGQSKSNLQPIPQVLKLEKSLLSSQTMQDAISKVHEPASDCLDGRRKGDMWREKTASDLHMRERNHEYSINKHLESVAPLHRPGLSAVAPSYDLSKSWSHSASSWDMASSSLSQKLSSVQTPPYLNVPGALSRGFQSRQVNGILEDSWPLNINSKPNPGFQYDVPIQNRFYPGSSSVSKEPSINVSSINNDYLNNDCKIIPERFINNDYKVSNSNCNGKRSGKDFDLNVILSNGSCNNLVPQSGVGIRDGELKHEERHAVLPWLRVKTTCKNEAQNTETGSTTGNSSFSHAASISNKDKTGKGPSGKFMHSATSVLCSYNIEPRRTGISESSSNKKILGVSIFDMPHISPKELSSITSPVMTIPNPSDVEVVETKKKSQIIDINLPCDADVVELDKEAFTETVVSKTRSPTTGANHQIDLNLTMSEDEESLTTVPSADIKMRVEIDLEAPAVPEEEEEEEEDAPAEKQLQASVASPQGPQDRVEQQQDELVKNAADAIVALSSLPCDQLDAVISSPSESPVVDPLSWFVDVVSSYKDNPEGKCGLSRENNGQDNECSSDPGDYFEYMTLNMKEMKEEEYMPQPLVPENFKVEETTPVPTRARRGPARRGRQRRDFQRDILPGLVSLSRHEVTEDIQTFGGIMRAAGHSWNSGLTRRTSSRNGSGRGRRRAQVAPSPPTPPPAPTNETSTPLMQQLNNIEVGLEDRSLTGWGKTTRRPRRQRCPAGNPPLIPLT